MAPTVYRGLHKHILLLYYNGNSCHEPVTLCSTHVALSSNAVICKLVDYDAKKLCHLTFQTVEKVIQDWSDSPPNDVTQVCSNHPHIISHHAIRNTRRKMEDRHVAVPSMSLYTDNKVFSYYSAV